MLHISTNSPFFGFQIWKQTSTPRHLNGQRGPYTGESRRITTDILLTTASTKRWCHRRKWISCLSRRNDRNARKSGYVLHASPGTSQATFRESWEPHRSMLPMEICVFEGVVGGSHRRRRLEVVKLQFQLVILLGRAQITPEDSAPVA